MKGARKNVAGLDVGAFRRDLRALEREIVDQLERETACCQVTQPQCHVLLELAQGARSLKSLAEALDLDKGNLSRTVETLVQAGLVEREEDPADRRAVRLTLARAGRQRVAALDDVCNRYYASLLGGMSPSGRQTVTRAMRLLAEGMKRLRKDAPVD